MFGSTFFKSRAFRNASLTAVLGASAGIGLSYSVALKLAASCSEVVGRLTHTLAGNITIPEIDATIHYDDENFEITIFNMTVVIPRNVWNMVQETASEFPDYCFSIPFIVGLILTAIAITGLSSTVGITTYLCNRKTPANNQPLYDEHEPLIVNINGPT